MTKEKFTVEGKQVVEKVKKLIAKGMSEESVCCTRIVPC